MKLKLKKELGVLDVFSIASGSMISSGLFILPSVVYLIAGPSIILSYIIAGIIVIPAMFSKAELATAMPKSGGVYFFIHRSLGPLFGTFAGFAAWFSLSLKSAFALLGIGIFLSPLIPAFSTEMVKVIAVCVTICFAILNIFSVKESGRFQVIMVFSLVTILLLYIIFGVMHININRYVPFNPHGFKSIIYTVGMIFISFGGLTKVASIAEEIKNPGKIIPLGMFSAFFVVTILYVLTVFVTIGLLDNTEFQRTLTPISLGASKYAGNLGYLVMAIAAMLAFITTANAGLMAASRSPLAMAKDNLLPSLFSKISAKYKTPVVSILMTSIFMIFVIIFLDLEELVKVASTMKLILFAMVNVSVIMMRESKIVSYRPKFKSPFYPYLQIMGTIFYLFLIIEMGKIPIVLTSGFFTISLLWYFLYVKSKNQRDSALIHIVERATSKVLVSRNLESELREIIRERDEIVKDRFDHIIEESIIIDIDNSIKIEDFFTLASNSFAERFNLKPDGLLDLLWQREKESSTAITPFLAIPHIIIEGEHSFDILLARCKSGIKFSEDSPAVKSVFILVGTRDERNFHLRALSSIAQIVQNPQFEKRWIEAKNTEDLRDIVLLGKRNR